MAMGFFVSLLSVVQVVTESLPISSSGHDALVRCLIAWGEGQSPMVSEALYHLWHIPTLLMVIIFFRKRWFFLLQHVVRCYGHILRLVLLGFCAEVPTMCAYFFFISTSWSIPLWGGFLVTSGLLLSTRGLAITSRLTYGRAFLIGCAQGMALLPGISRLASTYAMARIVGIAPRTAWLFSWTIGFPLMAGACIKDWHAYALLSVPEWLLLAGAGGVAYIIFVWSAQMLAQDAWWKLGFYVLFPTLLAFFIC